ncbi:hypothetical protein CHS0354_033390 [Potamilus streckersoni]|uniref:Uncharacterized protein n=1 Tax=Potamilus streckersoni TaxID=2493646 RepID=A0AAE0RTJ3_9BIVA|nr:hypothetical protein CHS0354_033390 [Potamilus streckersoni]
MFLPHSLIIIATCELVTLSSGGDKSCINDGTTKHCYHIVDANVTWNEASDVCNNDSGMLINIDSANEQNFIAGEPSGADDESEENCAEISINNMKWNDKSCSDTRGYICEKTQVDCYKEITTYTGQQSVTISGRICQAWSLNTPHSHKYHEDSMFPDGKEDTAANFCRDPSKSGFLWCYTLDRAKRWEECPIWFCEKTGGTEPCMKDESSGHCYQILDTQITWNQAFYKCERNGGNLVTIESVEEQQFISDLMRMRKRFFETVGLWIGSNKLQPEDQRSWVNGEQFSYVNWAEGEPNSPLVIENCAEIYSLDGTWNDLPCTELRGYICENSRAARKYIQDNATGLWFNLVDAQVTWAKALNICMSDGGILMIIETAEKQKFIDAQIKMMNMTFTARGLWIGLNKLHHEKKRTWINGQNFTYSNWAEGEPNNTPYDKTCAEMYTFTMKWNDEVCTSLRGYICEKIPPVTPDSSQRLDFVIGIAVGSALVFLVGIVLLYCLIKTRTKCKKNDEDYHDVQDRDMYQAEHVYHQHSDLDSNYCTIDDNV